MVCDAAGGPKTIENLEKTAQNICFLNFGHRECYKAYVCARAKVCGVSSWANKFAQTLHMEFREIPADVQFWAVSAARGV